VGVPRAGLAGCGRRAGRAGRGRELRLFVSSTAGSSMAAISRIGDVQRGQRRASTSKTR
jgi:hypothetical protein